MKILAGIYFLLYVIYLGSNFFKGLETNAASNLEFWIGWSVGAMSVYTILTVLVPLYPKRREFWVAILLVIGVFEIVSLWNDGLFVPDVSFYTNLVVGIQYFFLVGPPLVVSTWNIRRSGPDKSALAQH